MEHIKTIVIENPPYKFEKWVDKKVKRRGRGGKMYYTGQTERTLETFYLSANLFFNRNVWAVDEIKKECLRFLKPHFDELPKIERMRLGIKIYSNKTQFDIDNKGYFWSKILLDLLKTPTPTEKRNAHLKGNDIISCEKIKDDTVKYVDQVYFRYAGPGNKIEFIINGRLLDVQQKLL